MTYLRKLFWKFSNKNLHKIFLSYKKYKNKFDYKEYIFLEQKMYNVNDPVIDVNKIMRKRENIDPKYSWLNNKRYVVSIGRLSNQKNFIFLIKNF